MPFDVYEMYNSRDVNLSFDSKAATLQFFGYGTMDDAVARAGFIAVVPLFFFGLQFQDMDITTPGGLCWLCTARYSSLVSEALPGLEGSPSANPDPGTTPPAATTPLGAEYSFDISAVMEHITQSISTKAREKRNSPLVPAPDNKGAIGITADGEVLGCDVPRPHLEWSTSRVFGYITLDYIYTLYSLVGKKNDAVFYGFPIGTNVLMGASLSARQGENVTVTFKFAAQPNQVIALEGFSAVNKGGWDYLWVGYKSVEDAGQLTQQPDTLYIEEVIPEGDFSKIGIGA